MKIEAFVFELVSIVVEISAITVAGLAAFVIAACATDGKCNDSADPCENAFDAATYARTQTTLNLLGGVHGINSVIAFQHGKMSGRKKCAEGRK